MQWGSNFLWQNRRTSYDAKGVNKYYLKKENNKRIRQNNKLLVPSRNQNQNKTERKKIECVFLFYMYFFFSFLLTRAPAGFER